VQTCGVEVGVRVGVVVGKWPQLAELGKQNVSNEPLSGSSIHALVWSNDEQKELEKRPTEQKSSE